MSDPAEAAHLRELQRRAFARPRTPEDEADAAAAAAELAALRPMRAPVLANERMPNPPPETFEGETDDVATDGAEAESLAAEIRRRLAHLTGGERRGIAIATGALVLLTGVLVLAHAALTAPPPALAVFESGPSSSERETGEEDPAESILRSQLSQRGVVLVGNPHVFGAFSLEPRLVAYRQQVTSSITEICAAVVVEAAYPVGFTCTSEQRFRTEGLTGSYDDGSYGLDFFWRPDGTTSVELVARGAVTLEEVRALGIPAMAALEANPTPADALIWNFEPDTIAGPLLLDEVDGVQYVGLLTGDDDSIGRLGDAPAFCLWVGDAQSNAGACTTPELFARDGVAVGTNGANTRWLPTGELVVEQP